ISRLRSTTSVGNPGCRACITRVSITTVSPSRTLVVNGTTLIPFLFVVRQKNGIWRSYVSVRSCRHSSAQGTVPCQGLPYRDSHRSSRRAALLLSAQKHFRGVLRNRHRFRRF